MSFPGSALQARFPSEVEPASVREQETTLGWGQSTCLLVTQVEVSGGDQPAILNRSIVPTYLPSTESGRREIGFEARLMRRLAVLSIWKAHSGYCLQTQSAFHRYLVKCRFPKDAGSELDVSLAPGQSGRKI